MFDTLKEIDVGIYTKALQFPNTRQVSFLEGFQQEVDCDNWTQWLNTKLTQWHKANFNGEEKYKGSPLLCALRMAHVKTDTKPQHGQKNPNPRAPHVEVRTEQANRVKDGLRCILKSEAFKTRTNNTIQLVSILNKGRG